MVRKKKNNVSYNPIESITEDWGLDIRNGFTYSGESVQEFIKKQLESKAGCFYYDAANNRYLVFADTINRDLYLENPSEHLDLVIGNFEAPFNYTAEINLKTPTYTAVLANAKGNYIDYTFDVKNKNGQSTGESVIATYTFIKGGSKQVVTERYTYGASVHFNIDKYISAGTNQITIGITGQTSLAATTVNVTYQVVELVLKDYMDISKAYDLFETPDLVLAIPYDISGSGTKIMEWYLDGEQLEYIKGEDEIVDTSTSRTKYISLAGLNNGTHNIQFRAYTLVNGEKFYSDTLYRDIIIYTRIDRNNIIAVAADIPTGKDIISSGGTLTLYGLTQYVAYSLRFAVFSPTGAESVDVEVCVDSIKQTTVATHNNEETTYTYVPTITGVHTLTLTAGTTTYTMSMDISEAGAAIIEVTDGLQLDLRALGKGNNTSDRDVWGYGEYVAAFEGFEWNNRSGWTGTSLYIPKGCSLGVNLAPLSPDPTSNGKTIEIEFATQKVTDDNEVICDLMQNGVGLKITASKATMISQGGSEVTTHFKSGEPVRLAFVINRKYGTANKCLSFIYVNGVCSGAAYFALTDNFTSIKELLFRGTDNAEIELIHLRIYNTALTANQILNNYMLYRSNTEEMLSIYEKNNIYIEGSQEFSPELLSSQLPVFIVTGDIPTLENTTDKNTTIVVDIEYTNLQDPSRSFTLKNAQMRPQGTSSMSYPKKNFRFYTEKRDDTVLYDAGGKIVTERKYAFKEGSTPVNCWCLKADYAESSGTHNTGIARLWNSALVNAQVEGEYVLRTNAQKAAKEYDYPYDVRTTIDGFPVVMFYRLTEDSPLVFMGKYNFNNDKSTENVFGFKGIPGFDNARMQCWEVLNNGNHLALFSDVDNFYNEWQDAFEARYPDVGDKANVKDLYAFCSWMVSTKNDLQKFKDEKGNHLHLPLLAAYYVYFMRFGAVDQTVKNAMLTSEDGEHFYFINYDNDTVNGLRNDGLLKYPPTMDRQTLDDTFATTVYAYAGHDSTLWNNFEADEECMSLVSVIDDALYRAGLSYANVIKMLDEQQSAKWCERVYNQDAQYKYIQPYTDNGINNLYMLQGSRESHRRWWLSRRFSLLDAKFVSGAYKNNTFEIKVAGAPIGINFSIVAGNNMDYGYGVNNVVIEKGVSLSVGEEHTFTTKQVLNIGDPLRIYSAPNLKSIDVSGFVEYLSTVNMGSVYDENLGSTLTSLVFGCNNKTNTSVTVLSGLKSAKNLQELDIRGFKSITDIDLSGHYYMRSFNAANSGLTSATFAEGAPYTSIVLPETLQALTLKGLTKLPKSGLTIEGMENIHTIEISKCPNITSDISFFTEWYNSKTTDDSMCSVIADSIKWLNVTVEEVLRIGAIKTAGGILELKGKISLVSCSQEEASQIRAVFGDNVFSNTSELWITAPDAIYLDGPTEINAGDTVTYLAVVFSQNPGTVRYVLSTTASGCTINEETGILTTTRTTSTRNIVVRAIHTPTSGAVTTVETAVKVKGLTTYSSAVISGPDILSELNVDYEYSAKYTPSEVTAKYDILWELSGDAVTQNLVKIKKQTKTSCILNVIAYPSGGTAALTVSLKYKSEFNSSYTTKTFAVEIYEEGVVAISTKYPRMMAMLYKLGYCGHEDKLYKEEAEAITTLDYSSITNTSEYPISGSYLSELDFWKFFTFVTRIKPTEGFISTVFPETLTSIELPSSNKGIYIYSKDAEYRLPKRVVISNVKSYYSAAMCKCDFTYAPNKKGTFILEAIESIQPASTSYTSWNLFVTPPRSSYIDLREITTPSLAGINVYGTIIFPSTIEKFPGVANWMYVSGDSAYYARMYNIPSVDYGELKKALFEGFSGAGIPEVIDHPNIELWDTTNRNCKAVVIKDNKECIGFFGSTANTPMVIPEGVEILTADMCLSDGRNEYYSWNGDIPSSLTNIGYGHIKRGDFTFYNVNKILDFSKIEYLPCVFSPLRSDTAYATPPEKPLHLVMGATQNANVSNVGLTAGIVNYEGVTTTIIPIFLGDTRGNYCHIFGGPSLPIDNEDTDITIDFDEAIFDWGDVQRGTCYVSLFSVSYRQSIKGKIKIKLTYTVSRERQCFISLTRGLSNYGYPFQASAAIQCLDLSEAFIRDGTSRIFVENLIVSGELIGQSGIYVTKSLSSTSNFPSDIRHYTYGRASTYKREGGSPLLYTIRGLSHLSTEELPSITILFRGEKHYIKRGVTETLILMRNDSSSSTVGLPYNYTECHTIDITDLWKDNTLDAFIGMLQFYYSSSSYIGKTVAQGTDKIVYVTEDEKAYIETYIEENPDSQLAKLLSASYCGFTMRVGTIFDDSVEFVDNVVIEEETVSLTTAEYTSLLSRIEALENSNTTDGEEIVE